MTHHLYRLQRGQLFEKCPHISNKWKNLRRSFILSEDIAKKHVFIIANLSIAQGKIAISNFLVLTLKLTNFIYLLVKMVHVVYQ